MARTVLSLLLATAPLSAVAQDSTERANPAAVFCEERGGTYTTQDTVAGAVGICRLPDGREVDAWEFFRENWNTPQNG